MNDGKIPSSADGSIPRQGMDCKIIVMSKLTDLETSRQVVCLQTALVSETDFYGPVVIEVALLLCTQRVGERYPVGPP